MDWELGCPMRQAVASWNLHMRGVVLCYVGCYLLSYWHCHLMAALLNIGAAEVQMRVAPDFLQQEIKVVL